MGSSSIGHAVYPKRLNNKGLKSLDIDSEDQWKNCGVMMWPSLTALHNTENYHCCWKLRAQAQQLGLQPATYHYFDSLFRPGRSCFRRRKTKDIPVLLSASISLRFLLHALNDSLELVLSI
ncbi:hypothetical protein ACTXT7_014698 [Hymenolepis weldensis]